MIKIVHIYFPMQNVAGSDGSLEQNDHDTAWSCLANGTNTPDMQTTPKLHSSTKNEPKRGHQEMTSRHGMRRDRFGPIASDFDFVRNASGSFSAFRLPSFKGRSGLSPEGAAGGRCLENDKSGPNMLLSIANDASPAAALFPGRGRSRKGLSSMASRTVRVAFSLFFCCGSNGRSGKGFSSTSILNIC